MFRITSFADLRRAKGDVLDYVTFQRFADALRVTPHTVKEKHELPCWSPCVFSGNRRSRDTAETFAAIVLDFDGVWSPEAACEHYNGRHALVHTTWSHSPVKPHFRVVIPTENPNTPAALWQRFVHTAIAELPGDITPDVRRIDTVYFWTHTKLENG